MNHSETETNARDLEEGKVAESSAYQIRNGGPEHKRNRIAGGRQDHKDSLNRYIRVGDTEKYQDHFLNPDDGKLVLLRVQCAKDYNRDSSLVTSWSSPLKPHPLAYAWKVFRESPKSILNWTYNERVREQAVLEGSLPEAETKYNRREIYWKYPIASLVLTFTALFGNFEGKSYPGGRYPPVRYKYFSYPKTPRNRGEAAGYSKTDESAPLLQQASADPVPSGGSLPQADRKEEDSIDDGVLIFNRHLRPRKLCVIRENDGSSQSTHASIDVVDLTERNGNNSTNEKGEYVFVSYTRDQFTTYTPEDLAKWPPPAEGKESVRSFMKSQWEEDRQRLIDIGVRAARDAGVKAFWIDVFCLGDGKLGTMDSHRICDVARGAKSMVIALQDTVETRALNQPTQEMDELLQNWSSRLWTLPEMLLAPTRHDLKVYLRKNGEYVSDTIPKRSMAARAYPTDGALIRQLVDHFEASQQLTLTELLTIGLECLINRKTYQFNTADQVYALMTMVRRRPVPNGDDTLFEAFAKLSLLNDSNSLLERLICILPESRGKPWYEMKDFWGVKLWEIEPTVQVAAIASDETVVLDGAFGATINWGELTQVGFQKRETIWRMIGSFIVRFAPGWLIIAIVTLASFARPLPIGFNTRTGHIKYATNPLVAVGIVFFLIALSTVASLPHVMMLLYSGKFWSTQALIFGLEGQADLEWLERRLFGFTQGRLRWSTWGSTQSLHDFKPTTDDAKWIEGEVEALKPRVTALKNAKPDGTDDDRIFTIVDTYSMTASLIRAVHPPTTALVCGQEGGMRRVLLCSYDYTTQTFHRETVIRMPTKVLDRMDRVDRFRFSMTSMPLRRSANTVM